MTRVHASPPRTPLLPANALTLPPQRGGRIRAGLRVAAIVLWTALLFLLWALGSIVVLLFPPQRIRWRHRVVRTWARALGSIVNMRVTVAGTPPKPPFFLVTNHLSYIDIILLYTRVDGVFIAKREMRHWPVLGPLANVFGTIWVNREVRRDAVRVLDLVDEAVARGDGVVVFPEGTTSGGDALLPMRPALFDWAAREQFPVHFASISYRTAPGEVPAYFSVGWWGAMPFGAHAWNLCRLRGFDAILEFGEQPIVAPTRGELAARVERAISARFVPLRETERLEK